MIRCFVGLPLPPSYHDHLSALLSRLRPLVRARLSWTRPENWHLTLKFLGETEPDRVAAATAALAGVRFPGFTLQAGGGGFFPDGRRPRVLWVGLIQGGPESAALAQAVDQALTPPGFAPEERPFTAHLTLGRVKDDPGQDWSRVLNLLGSTAWPVAAMERLVFWESRLGPRGPAYAPLAEYPLSAVSGDRIQPSGENTKRNEAGEKSEA